MHIVKHIQRTLVPRQLVEIRGGDDIGIFGSAQGTPREFRKTLDAGRFNEVTSHGVEVTHYGGATACTRQRKLSNSLTSSLPLVRQ
jgi:hypothetical protein